MIGKIPETMACIEIDGQGGPEVLRPTRRPVPTPGPREVLIRVAAAGINRPDIFQRKGLYPPPPGVTDLPGLEVAGEVVAAGPGISEPVIGKNVCALISGGGYAEYCTAPFDQCLPVPDRLSPTEAAALPETTYTVWHNLFDRAGLQAGETLLVHGGSSGIGTTAIQMAKAFGARVIATAGTPEKCNACRELGADLAIPYRSADFVTESMAFTEGRGVNVILDMVGGSYVERNIRVLAPDGRLAMIAFLEGSKVTVDLMPVMLKRLTLTGSTLRARPEEIKAEIARSLREKVWPLIESGSYRPVIQATYPLEKAAEAHRLMESGGHIGKIVLIPD